MCMFCVIQKWSRRVATMLPWLVIPLIGLWALSQLLPPAFRFEITSPRLACVFVLLVTLFWYEVLMPFLSAWRLRRNARLRERKRFEALELQKLKKTATRKCRNCLTPYRDQNPGGGKFMCSYCGHISKRPVLDLPVPAGMAGSNPGIFKDLFGKGGRILNGKSWSDNVSICSQDWMENGSWIVNGSFPVKSGYPLRKSDGFFSSGSEPCLAEKSYSGSFFFACKLLTSCLASIRWLWRKLFRISSSKEDTSSDAERRAMLSKKGENSSGPESRGEKARRKAEEKRQARLEKELFEEEERKQREEVARLVEERRRLRDEKLEAENRAKGTFSLRENNVKKEAEKRRNERRREKDKGSSKSNSDVDELDKKAGKDNERKSENERRESVKIGGLDSGKSYNFESGMGFKSNNNSLLNNSSQRHVGARYFDRMRGTFTGRGFFGKAAPTPAPSPAPVFSGRRDFHTQDRLGKTVMNRDDRSDIRPVVSDPKLRTTSMSWQHLFTRSPASASAPASSSSHSNVISRPSAKSQVEMQNPHPHPPCSVSSPQLYDNPINLPLPFVLPSFSTTLSNTSSTTLPTPNKDPFFPSVAEMSHDLLPEEPELFEDPCYEPDPVSLLGPVSESLYNFQLDLGNNSHSINVSSPTESPVSRSDEKKNSCNRLSNSPKANEMYTFPTCDVNGTRSEAGSWHMWNSSPVGWIAPNEEMMHYSPQKSMASLFAKDETRSPHNNVFAGNAQACTPFSSSIPRLGDQVEPWMQNTYFPALSSGEKNVPTSTSPTKEASLKTVVSASNHTYDPLSAGSWSKNEWNAQGNGNPTVVKSPPVRGLFSSPDVQSLW